MISIRTNRGYDLNPDGKPDHLLSVLDKPTYMAVVPERLRFVKPRLAISVGDAVRIGSVLFVDKRYPEIKFLSPAGGRVTAVNYGRRRVIKSIVVARDRVESFETFDALDPAGLAAVTRGRLTAMLLAGGLWPLLRQLPFRDMAHPGEIPPAVIVTMGSREPFFPRASVYLAGNERLFAFGVQVLQKLTDGRVMVTADAAERDTLSDISETITHAYRGAYPAHDPGVVCYQTKTRPEENRAWYIDAQDVLLIAQLLKTGTYPTERVVVVAGSGVATRRHYRTRMGAPLSHLLDASPPADGCRLVVGGLLTGTRCDPDGFLSLYDTSLVVVPEGNTREFMALANPGYRKNSFSRAFLSIFNNAPLVMNCNTHGDLRACIGCNHCSRVCPVDMLPQLTYKALLAGEVEEALVHGLLDCVECGLCTYVCPAKIELTTALVAAKAAYYKEQTSE